jgi:anti-sigma-K factor RskA
MSDHDRDLAAGAALGSLSAEDAARLERDAAGSPELAAHVDEYAATVSMLESAVAREAPPANLFDRVLERIDAEDAAAEPAAAPAAPPKPRRSFAARARRFWPAFAAGAATAAAAAALIFVVTGGDNLGSAELRAAVSGTEEFPAVHGEARLYSASGEDGRLVVDLDDVPAPGPGEHYEVWVLRKAGEGEMEAVGVFSPTSSTVDLEYRLPGPGDYEAVDVSIEPDAGPPSHSGRSLAGGLFEPET